MVNKTMNLFAKRFRPAFAEALRAGRSKAPSAASLSPVQFGDRLRTAFDFLPTLYCDTVSRGRGGKSLILILCTSIFLATSISYSATQKFIDEVGREVTFPFPPKRIVSLAPSITELVCALGMRDRLVGITSYCHYPPGVESVPAVGALQDPNFEKVRSLSPDRVLITANSRRLAAGLDELGLNYRRVPHDTLADVFGAIEAAGQGCERPVTAQRLAEAIRSDLDSLQRWAGRSVRHRQRVLIVLGTLPVPPQALWAAGPGSFLDELIASAGHLNAAREVLKVSHGEVPLARLRSLDPDVILEFGPKRSDHDRLEMYRSWSEIGPMRAIDQQRVRVVGDAEWLSAGPRIAIALHRIIATMAEFDR